jgi:multiple sugar transport system substrate-binding protein
MWVVPQPAFLLQTDYSRRLRGALSGDAPPDAFLLDDVDMPAVADRGGALDLSPYLSRVGVDLARYQPVVLAMFRRGAAVYALPRGYTPLVVAYNRAVLERAGVDAPTDDWTWDDFLNIARRLTLGGAGDARPAVWGAGFDRRPAVWVPWIWSGGGDVLCSDGRRASGCLDTPLTIAAIRWYAGWVTHTRVSPRVSAARDWDAERMQLFVAGRLGMMTVDHSAIRAFRSAGASGRLRVGFVAIPHRRGAAPITALYASGYAVPAPTLGRKSAVELAAALTDSLADAARGDAGIELPAVTAAARALAAADTLGWEAAFLRAAEQGRPGWGARVPQWRLVETELADLMDRVTVGGADAGRAARATARDLDRLLGATR